MAGDENDRPDCLYNIDKCSRVDKFRSQELDLHRIVAPSLWLRLIANLKTHSHPQTSFVRILWSIVEPYNAKHGGPTILLKLENGLRDVIRRAKSSLRYPIALKLHVTRTHKLT